jgi:2-polyprenyl-3-methyl-5-hydroxy-6-metoxy-1,4-benzoquinol methylase
MRNIGPSSDHGAVVGQRFEFGANWAKFLREVDSERITRAEKSIQEMLGKPWMQGARFLDIGSGSGLFSLAARRLGATVHSFDCDPKSIACTLELRRRHFPEDSAWVVEEASVLDSNYLGQLGHFDVVYCWGVLHHTGAMWQALSNVAALVAANGILYLAIYNDQGRASRIWTRIKRFYCVSPRPAKALILFLAFVRLWGPSMLRDLLAGRPGYTWRNYGGGAGVGGRGMSPWRDVVDWVGGYPFEVAKPEEIFAFYRQKGFQLERLKTVAGGHGCNEFVFKLSSS